MNPNKKESENNEKKEKTRKVNKRYTCIELKRFDFQKKTDFFSSDENEEDENNKKNADNKIDKDENKNNEKEEIEDEEDEDALSENTKQHLNLKKIYTLKNINFTVKEGEFVCIIGEVGSGKSSLVQALLNNMIILNKEETNVVLNGSISYVPQEAWIQNDTVKNNILFYLPFDSERYM